MIASRRLHCLGGLCLAACLACVSVADPSAQPGPRATRVETVPWMELGSAPGYNGSKVVKTLPVEVGRIDRVLRNRALYRGEGFGFGQLMLGPGALYPYHSHASPEAYHVLSGEAEWSVDGETRRVGPGTTIYHAPYADHRWVTTSSEPLRVVWAQWAPDGDRSGLVADAVRRRGGSTTADFFALERRSRSILPIDLAAPVMRPAPGSDIDTMRKARLAARTDEPPRPAARAFIDSVAVPWNTELRGVHWRVVFGTPDLEWGHFVIQAPGRRFIPASSAPWLLHVLSGQARVKAGDEGDGLRVRRGTSVVVMPSETVEVEFEEDLDEGADRAPLRGMWIRWAPGGDLGYWARDYFLVEPVPEPPEGSELARDEMF